MGWLHELSVFAKYFLFSYVLIWIIATPLILIASAAKGIEFTADYYALIGNIPLYVSVPIVCLSAIPSYYLPASLYFDVIRRRLSGWLVLSVALSFWALSMVLDIVFVVWLSGIDVSSYPFNWIYLSVSPVMVLSVCLAGAHKMREKVGADE